MFTPKAGNYILIQFTDQGPEFFWGERTDGETKELQKWLKENLIGGRLAGLSGSGAEDLLPERIEANAGD